MKRLAALLLVCVLAPSLAAAEQFDRTVPAARGARLDVRLFGGEVVVQAWEKDAVRIRATHFRTDVIQVQATGAAINVRARARRGTPHAIDFEIDVPAWMPVSVAGTYVDIGISGTRAGVRAETVRGDVRVAGGSGTIVLNSVEGEVVLENAEGRVELGSVNNTVRATRVRGDVSVETVSGSVKLLEVSSPAVSVSTMSGDISWEGALTPGGHYELATHSGDVDVALGAGASATLNVRAFEGLVRSPLPLKLPAADARRKRFTTVLGAGAAQVVLETFSGVISIR